MSDVDEDASQFTTIQRLTNKRQATKICDVKRDATLVLEKTGNRTEYVTGTDEGLYAVGIGSGGGLYMARVLTPPQITSLARGAEIDVAQSTDGLPDAITDPKVGSK